MTAYNSVEFDALASNIRALPPAPPPPESAFAGEEDPSSYIPEGMTPDQRQMLRETAGSLAGLFASPLLARAQPQYDQASKHMGHFTSGGGAPLELTDEQVDDLIDSNENARLFALSLQGSVLLRMNADFQRRDVRYQQYISRNNRSTSANYGTPWFGKVGDEDGNQKWFYAMGSFWACYTFLAERTASEVIITYRTLIFDRYNWHNDMGVNLPGVIAAGIPPDHLEAMENIITAGDDDYPFLSRGQLEDGRQIVRVDDSIFGSLIEDDEAHAFNITGGGTIQRVHFPLEANP